MYAIGLDIGCSALKYAKILLDTFIGISNEEPKPRHNRPDLHLGGYAHIIRA